MSGILSQFRGAGRAGQLLLLNHFSASFGFFMLMPYLAVHLSAGVGLAGWLVGLILGLRNFTQQGMFLAGGILADRFGYKPLIVAGCVLRTAGFVMLGFAGTLPVLLLGAAATGFAGALFVPAGRAYLAVIAGDQRVSAFALLNVFYQAGLLLGPLVGLALTAVAFPLTCAVAAAVFAVMTWLQAWLLPADRSHARAAAGESVRWRELWGNRAFLAFADAMTGSYVLLYQTYQMLPLESRRLTASDVQTTMAMGLMFALSGTIAVAGQLRVTRWCRARWTQVQSISAGLSLMGLAFVLPLGGATMAPPAAGAGEVLALAPLVFAGVLLTLGSVVAFPFEMDIIVVLARNRAVATHYGLYSTVSGAGLTVAGLGAGAALDLSRDIGIPWMPWVGMAMIGMSCGLAVRYLGRAGWLTPPAGVSGNTDRGSAVTESKPQRADRAARTRE